MTRLLAITIESGPVVVGVLTGLTYAVLAAGLVLLFRATGIINFAHGEIGALSAAALFKLVVDLQWPYWLAFVTVVAGGGLVGAAVELGVVRRLAGAPKLVLLVATIGVAQLLFFAQFLGAFRTTGSTTFPIPFERQLRVAGVLLLGEHFLIIAFVPALIVALALFLARTPFGLAIRATATNLDAARLAGLDTKRVSTVVWVLAGVLSAVTAILIGPLRAASLGPLSGEALGPALLLRALTAALVGGLVSLPLAFVGGISIGVLEALLFVNLPTQPGVVDALLFATVLALVLLRRIPRSEEGGTPRALTPRVPPMPAGLESVWWVRHLPAIGAGVALAVALLLAVVVPTSSQLFLLTRVACYAMVGLSVTILTGWAGQLSLGQFAFVGIGALTCTALVGRGVPFVPAVIWATGAGALAAMAVGFPALRLPGVLLAVTTLGFAIAAKSWLFPLDLFTNGSSALFLPRPELLGVDLRSQRLYYVMSVLVLAAVVAVVAALRRSGLGRRIIAVRDNADGATACTVPAAATRLTAFAISGGIAALAGALLAGNAVQFSVGDFGPDESLRVVAMTIIGGLGSIAGSVLGAVYVLGVPAIFDNAPAAKVLSSGAGLLVLLLYLPSGLAGVLYRARDALLHRVARRLPPVAPAAPAAARPVSLRRRGEVPTAPNPGAPALRAEGITVRFGGRVALAGVSLEVAPREVVGLIGSNGAGKSTLMNVLSGFQPAEGRVELLGVDITALPAHQRAVAGLGRAFQDARLFADLSVVDTVKVALEARERSETLPSLLALPPARRAERRKSEEADELVAFLGLGRYARTFVSDLSTGTRRIAELACLIALGPRVVLLDEPTAGVAQREAEAFGPLILRVKEELDASVVVIEHDIPLVMSLSDRVYCLGAGRVIASGLPDEVRTDPAVIASYLGTDERAILRSGAVPA